MRGGQKPPISTQGEQLQKLNDDEGDARFRQDVAAGANRYLAWKDYKNRLRMVERRWGEKAQANRARKRIRLEQQWHEKHDNSNDAHKSWKDWYNEYGQKFDGDRADLPEKWVRKPMTRQELNYGKQGKAEFAPTIVARFRKSGEAREARS